MSDVDRLLRVCQILLKVLKSHLRLGTIFEAQKYAAEQR